MKKKSLWLGLSFLLVAALVLASCGPAEEEGEQEEEEEEEAVLPSAQEIIDGMLEAQNNTETYKLDMDMDMDMSVEMEDETIEMTMGMAMSGAIDLENMEMEMDVVIDMVVPEEGEMEMAVEMYIIEDMMYAGTDMLSLTDGFMWFKSEMPEGIFEQMNQVAPQIELLESAEVEVIGSEKVNSIDCYILEVRPDTDKLWELVMQQSSVTSEIALPDIVDEFVSEMLDSFSVRYYVAKDTYFLMKSVIDMTLEVTPDALGFPEEEGLMAMNVMVDLLAYDYNLPVSIELPPEAEEAVEVPTDSFGW